MKKIIQTISILLLPFFTVAQINILEQLGESQIGSQYWIEKGDSYYFISKQMTGPANTATQYKASQYILNRYDKNSHQLLAWKVVAGDTLQNDSVVAKAPALFMQGDRFYIQYTKYRAEGGFIRNREYYQQLKVDFTTVVAETRYGDDNNIVYTITSCSGPMENGNFFVGYKTNDTFGSGTSGYVMLDTVGNVIQAGQPGVLNPNGPTAKTFRCFTSLGNHQYLQSGTVFLGSSANVYPPYFGWCITDENMNILDTFFYKRGMVQCDTPLRFTIAPLNLMLPTGSIIAVSTGWRPEDGQEMTDKSYLLLTKHTAATRFGVDKYLTFGPVDSADLSQGGYAAYQQVVYNPHDNKLYFGFMTHRRLWGFICNQDATQDYLEVICTDTSLNLNWRKLIKMQGICSDLGTLSVPDGDSGIFASGFSYTDFEVDTFKMWVYHINDSTPSADITAIAAVNAGEEHLRIYPNPASDLLYLVSETGQLREAGLYDLSGRLLLTRRVAKERTEIDMNPFPPGIYLLKCMDKEGNVYVRKVQKQ